MELKKAIEEKKFDTRILERNRARQVVSEAEIQTYLKGLPDDSERMDSVDLSEPDLAYPHLKGPTLTNGQVEKTGEEGIEDLGAEGTH